MKETHLKRACLATVWAFALLGSSVGSAAEIPLEGSYFVDPSATGANNGRSPTDAWTSLSSASGMPVGADLYLKSDAVFEDQRLVIRWSGTPDDHVVVGSFCMNGSTPSSSGCSKRAEINGTFDANCRPDKTCAVDTSDAVPSSRWEALVQVEADYVTVQNLLVKDSAAQGVKTGSNKHHIIFEDLEVAFPAAAGIRAGRGAHHLTIRRNYIHDAALCHDGYVECPLWPATILLVVAGGHSSVAEDNEIYRSYGEGIGMYAVNTSSLGGYSIIRGNRIGDVRSASIYVSGTSHNIIEGNVVWQPPVPTYAESLKWEGIGLNAEDEIDAWNSTGHVVRNNVIHNRSECFRIGMGLENAKAGIKVGGRIYGNTCVGARNHGVLISQTVRDHGALSSDFEFRNNIVYTPGVAGHLCATAPGAGTWSHNLWSHELTGNVAPNCAGSGDVIGRPDLATDPDRWSFPGFRAGPRSSDFQLTTNAARGTALPETILDTSDYDLFHSLSAPFDPDVAAWTKQNAYDIKGVMRPMVPSLGADEYGDSLAGADPGEVAPRAPVLY